MLAVLAVCAAPVVASYLTYYAVLPAPGVRAYGQLIEPQRPIPDASVRRPDGQTEPFVRQKGQWLLVSVSGGACDPQCEAHLYLQRQLREMLGREKDRLDWVWLVSDTEAVRPPLRSGVAAATILYVDRAVLTNWLQPAPGKRLEDHLFLVDPQGHWMMRFPSSLDRSEAGKAKRDLERLMRASAGWDQPGRPTAEGGP